MHPIDRYCGEAGLSRSEFARRLGVSPQLLCDVTAGRTRLSDSNKLKMVEVTGGEITLAELVGWKLGKAA